MNAVSKKVIFNLLSKQEGDSFELGKKYFFSLSRDEKEEVKRSLNETSLHYFYFISDQDIHRVRLVRRW